jgi:hypothetical protein
MAMLTMKYQLSGSRLILLHSKDPPPASDWGPYMNEARRMDQVCQGDLSRAGILVFTDGGAPNATQRSEINEWLAGRKIRTAVVMSSPLVRGIVTALNWFNKDIKPFAPQGWRDAMSFVGFRANEHERIRQEILSLLEDRGFQCRVVDQAFAGPSA